MTAQEIVTRIRQKLADQGISWRTETVDTFKAGNPETPRSRASRRPAWRRSTC